MAHYQGRRAPNVSQYIANLNTVQPTMDMNHQDFAGLDDDLALFTNTDLFDFDLNAPITDVPSDHMNFADGGPSPNTTEKLGYVNQSSYYGNLGQFSQQPISGHSSAPTSPPNGLPFAVQMQQSQPTIPSMQHFTHILSPPSQDQTAGQKRKATTAGLNTNVEPPAAEYEGEEGRVAAEEDKRRRNTAASARFRVKKKQREQALEKTAKEMSDKVQVLEARIGQLEMENQWLKGLITEKNVKLEGSPADMAGKNKKAKSTVEDEKMAAERREDLERSPAEKKRGVGTVEKVAKA